MTQKHTPGPWIESDCDDWSVDHDTAATVSWTAINARNGRAVALPVITGFNDDELTANARLIAAAPDLLEALLLLHSTQMNNHCHDPDDYENTDEAAVVRAAIKKATGGTV